jgi:HEPN domain-containing protein
MRREWLTLNNKNSKVIEKWLSESSLDLKSADLLYDHQLFSRALYLLQQSNEKLVKGLLLSIGMLTPKTTKKDWRIKAALGFLPKKPVSYRHKTMQSLLADVSKAVPAIEETLKLIEHNEWEPKITEFKRTIERSKKGVQKLKKKPFNLIETAEQLEKEIKAAQGILDAIDQTTKKVRQELNELDFQEIVRVAVAVARKVGIKGDIRPLASFQKIKEDITRQLNLSILATLSASIASFLDPLESVTRYPDSEQVAFNETNPYVIHFKGLRDIIALILEKSQETIKLKIKKKDVS